MSTIPVSTLVNVIPNVLNAGGNALVMNGLVLTQNTRVPTGLVLSFPNDGVSVANFFGPASNEATIATTYFQGFNGATQQPSAILFTQYNTAAVAAYLRGGNVAQLTLAALQAITGTLTVVMDGYARVAASINLSTANSFSAAAALIQTALNTTPVVGATVTGAIAPATASVTGSIAGNILTVTAVSSGVLVPGSILTGTGVTAGTQITSQLSGTTQGIGTYAVSAAQVTPSTTITTTYGVLTVSAVSSGTLAIGQTLSGASVVVGTQITGLGTGTGLTGTYFVSPTGTTASTTITASSTSVAVSFDSVSGAFVITSGIVGSSSTAAFATGTAAAPLFLSAATGNALSQGAYAATPNAFMQALIQQTQNWASFMTSFDPDGGSGNTQKQAFANWNNGTNNRYAYIAWDTDITPTLSSNATSSLGNILQASSVSGTAPIYEPSDLQQAAAVIGWIASINFGATNGRITFAFRGQSGLVAGVTNATVAANLIANTYNFYGAYATANQQFQLFQPGQVTGKFQWLDTYVNQIYLNQALQLALINLLVQVNSIPYNTFGFELIVAACLDPINQAVNFGSIRAGVILSNAQIAEINAAAGNTTAAATVQSQGWYLQVLPPTPQARQARQTPICNFWYADGEAVQKITLNSVVVQ